MRTFINPIVKSKINFMNSLAATYHGRIAIILQYMIRKDLTNFMKFEYIFMVVSAM